MTLKETASSLYFKEHIRIFSRVEDYQIVYEGTVENIPEELKELDSGAVSIALAQNYETRMVTPFLTVSVG